MCIRDSNSAVTNLTLGQADVAALLPTGVTTLYIKGDTTDRVVLRDTWQSGSPVTEGGITYQVFTRNGFNVYAQNGLTGPPTIEGTSSADTIQGGSEAEVINAGEGDNNIAAGGGNDTVNAGSGADTIDAGTGDNTVASGAGNDSITAGSGNDSITSGTGNDSINAGAGNDTVNAGGGNDDIDAGTGADSIVAGDGNDTILFDAADQLVDGGTGTNVLKINDASVDLTTINNALLTNIQVIDLANSAASTLVLAEADVTALLPSGSTTLYVKGDANDRVVFREAWDVNGTATVDGIQYQVFARNGLNVYAQVGLTGNMEIAGSANADNILGGSGADNIDAGNGNNTVNSGGGNDVVNSGIGADTIDGGSGNNTINSGAGNDSVTTGDGNDSIMAGEGNDVISAGAGNDTVIAGDGNDSVSGGAGNDSISTGLGQDTLNGGDGNDVFFIQVDGLRDYFNGDAGFDLLNYQESTEAINTQTQNNFLAKNTTTFSILANNVLQTYNSIEGIVGSKGNDYLRESGGNEVYFDGY